jgi:methylenetetrahydrofolate dehydrogenase (NADP+)/methenyltetrahydrofolate cyclohydrolase
MTARILDGKGIAMTIRQEVAQRVSAFREKFGTSPKLVAVLVGQDPASQVYVRNKEIACQKAGIDSQVLKLDASTTTACLLETLDRLNQDPSVHGILVQLPLPDHLDSRLVLDRIDPSKDVDAFSPENVGLMTQGRPRFLPCTPHGVLQLLDRSGIELCGKHVVVVGQCNGDLLPQPDPELAFDHSTRRRTSCRDRQAQLHHCRDGQAWSGGHRRRYQSTR